MNELHRLATHVHCTRVELDWLLSGATNPLERMWLERRKVGNDLARKIILGLIVERT